MQKREPLGPRSRCIVDIWEGLRDDLRRLHQHRDGDWRKQGEGDCEAYDLGHLLVLKVFRSSMIKRCRARFRWMRR